MCSFDVLVGVPGRFSSPFSTLAICYAGFILRTYGVFSNFRGFNIADMSSLAEKSVNFL